MQRRSLTRTVLGLALGSIAALGPLCSPAAHAEEAWPSKTIRFVVPYPPGGPTDLMARLLQGEMQTRLAAAAGQRRAARRGALSNGGAVGQPSCGR